MGRNDHIYDRKIIYVDELEEILDEIEWWEQEYDDNDVPGNRDPQSKNEALAQIAKLRAKFNEEKAALEKAGKPIYR